MDRLESSLGARSVLGRDSAPDRGTHHPMVRPIALPRNPAAERPALTHVRVTGVASGAPRRTTAVAGGRWCAKTAAGGAAGVGRRGRRASRPFGWPPGSQGLGGQVGGDAGAPAGSGEPELRSRVEPLVEPLGVQPGMQQAVPEVLDEGPHARFRDDREKLFAVLR